MVTFGGAGGQSFNIWIWGTQFSPFQLGRKKVEDRCPYRARFSSQPLQHAEGRIQVTDVDLRSFFPKNTFLLFFVFVFLKKNFSVQPPPITNERVVECASSAAEVGRL